MFLDSGFPLCLKALHQIVHSPKLDDLSSAQSTADLSPSLHLPPKLSYFLVLTVPKNSTGFSCLYASAMLPRNQCRRH